MYQEFYYGQPQAIWDILCAEAEDLLQEYELGMHLVAAYPAGNRIYGLESCPPGIFCLYVDSVEAIIDPLSDYHKTSGFRIFSTGDNNYPIIMADLYKWAQWLVYKQEDWMKKAFLHAIPFGRHTIHEDQSIQEILEAGFEFMKEVEFDPAINDDLFGVSHNGYVDPNKYLFLRTQAILFNTGQFLPNINPKWDGVSNRIPEGIEEDPSILTKLLEDNNHKIPSQEYRKFCPLTGYRSQPKTASLACRNRLRSAVMDFYRFQL